MNGQKVAKLLWALLCSAIGLPLATFAWIAGGKAKWSSGALEVTYRDSRACCGKLAQTLPFRGIVFGHVILAVTTEELRTIRAHERVHVEQYEQWGPFFCSLMLRIACGNCYDGAARTGTTISRSKHASSVPIAVKRHLA